MELIEIAQLVTGLATLIVASVLIWQMIIQKKALDIAHNDADTNMSLQSMESRSAQQRWLVDNCDQNMIDKLKKGFEYLNDEEKQIAQTHFDNVLQISDKVFIISDGQIVSSGKPQEIVKDQQARKIYFGDTY